MSSARAPLGHSVAAIANRSARRQGQTEPRQGGRGGYQFCATKFLEGSGNLGWRGELVRQAGVGVGPVVEEPMTAITNEVLRRLSGVSGTRAGTISEALVRHLHAFILEVRPSTVEWEQAIRFLTEVGARCTPERQEFILLSDTLGVSTLVDAMNYTPGEEGTESTVLGPFYLSDPPVVANGAVIDGGCLGTPLLVEGTLTDVEGHPLSGVQVDTWQADGDGFYDVQHDGGVRYLRARLESDANGNFRFWSIVPSPYPIPDDGPVGAMLREQGRHPYRPAHVHFRFAHPNIATLVTHIFLAGDPYLDSDAVFGVKDSLIEELDSCSPEEAPEGHQPGRTFARLRRTFVLIPAGYELA